MTKQKLIKKNKKAEYLIPRRHKTVQGVVSEAPEGFGFVILENDDDVYLSNHEMRSLMHGDTVQIKVIQQRDGRHSGELIKIIDSAERWKTFWRINKDHREARKICSGRIDIFKGEVLFKKFKKKLEKEVYSK